MIAAFRWWYIEWNGHDENDVVEINGIYNVMNDDKVNLEEINDNNDVIENDDSGVGYSGVMENLMRGSCND